MILGVDIGGTEVKLALMDHDGNIHARFSRSVNFDGYATPVMDTVISACRDALASSPCPPEGIAVSATGQIDARTGTVIGTNGAIPGYEGTPIRSRLEQTFGVPARVLNDANAAALGEYFLGAGRGYQDLLMITLGTGVGGGIILDGRLYQGRLGIAGELGHFTLYQDLSGAPAHPMAGKCLSVHPPGILTCSARWMPGQMMWPPALRGLSISSARSSS